MEPNENPAGAAAAEPTPAAPPSPPEPTPQVEEPTPAEVLRFDPFSAPIDKEGQPEIEATSAPAAPAPPAAAAPVAPAAPAPAAPTPTAPPDPRDYASLVQLNARLLEENQTLRGTTPPATPTPAAPKAEELQYQVSFPPELRAALQSEDPAVQMQGLQALATGIAHIAHLNVRKEYREHYNAQEAQIIEKIRTDSAARASAERIYSDFYTAYPQLNKAELRPTVSLAAAAVVKEAGGNPAWTPELRKKVADKVYGYFGAVPPAQTAEPTAAVPTPAPAPARAVAQPPRQRGVGVRPAAPAAPQPGSQEQHIDDVVNAFN